MPTTKQGHNFDMRNHEKTSTRAQTRQSGVFVRSTGGSQSLERGMRLLRAFLGGATELTNAELAERCDLPRPTVSRLTRSLVDGGFLEYDSEQSVYRLAPVCLSLSASYHQSHTECASVLPLLRETAQRESVNIGLLVNDGVHMVYLASFREGRGPIKRLVNTGSRIPIESYASGHALIAAMQPATQKQLLDRLAEAHGAAWPPLRKRIQQSITQYKRLAYCTLDSVPGLIALARAVRAPDGALCVVVLTMTQADDGHEKPIAKLAKMLQSLVQAMEKTWNKI